MSSVWDFMNFPFHLLPRRMDCLMFKLLCRNLQAPVITLPCPRTICITWVHRFHVLILIITIDNLCFQIWYIHITSHSFLFTSRRLLLLQQSGILFSPIMSETAVLSASLRWLNCFFLILIAFFKCTLKSHLNRHILNIWLPIPSHHCQCLHMHMSNKMNSWPK